MERVALVTGSSSGIGAAVARRFAEAGYRVVVNSARSVEAGRALAAELPGAIYLQADVSDEAQAKRLVADTIAQLGRLDVLVNNAGTTTFIPLDDLEAATPEIWRQIFDVNVIGVWQLITAAMSHLKATGSGSIVNISSQAGITASGSSLPYSVSKAAVNHMTRLLAKVAGPEVRVNALAPGLIDTPWYTDHKDVFEGTREYVENHTPLRRVGTPEDVAQAVLDLAHSTYVTGETLLVDGGMHLR